MHSKSKPKSSLLAQRLRRDLNGFVDFLTVRSDGTTDCEGSGRRGSGGRGDGLWTRKAEDVGPVKEGRRVGMIS